MKAELGVHRLFYPALHLSVSQHHPYSDSYCDTVVEISHDPEIRSGDLVAPMPKPDALQWEHWNPGKKAPPVDFESPNSVRLVSFSGYAYQRDDTLIVTLSASPDELRTHARRLAETLNLSNIAAESVLEGVLKDLVKLPAWLRDYAPNPSLVRTISIYLEPMWRERIEQNLAWDSPTWLGRLVLLNSIACSDRS